MITRRLLPFILPMKTALQYDAHWSPRGAKHIGSHSSRPAHEPRSLPYTQSIIQIPASPPARGLGVGLPSPRVRAMVATQSTWHGEHDSHIAGLHRLGQQLRCQELPIEHSAEQRAEDSGRVEHWGGAKKRCIRHGDALACSVRWLSCRTKTICGSSPPTRYHQVLNVSYSCGQVSGKSTGRWRPALTGVSEHPMELKRWWRLE